MKRFIFILALAVAGAASTQEVPPDVKLVRVAGTYTTCCVTPLDTDLSELCFERTDVAIPNDLGCMPVSAPDTKFCKTLTVPRTTFDDAEIRCFVIDKDRNLGDESDNKGDIDFTPPGKAKVVE